MSTTTQSSTTFAPTLTTTRTPTHTSQITTQVTSTTQPASQSTSPDVVPQNRTTFAYTTFQLRSSVELSHDKIITYIEKFVKHLQANFSGTIKITVKKSRKLLA
ncbi:hypothetical protein G5714_021974 [Onychostoma macrolepis]|uniref:Uncharacterized protein n=1 Tax=Onychostoma macrolepis TaxID=369639 RepID=A0A7J6BSL8_9TELE|nr:hypothetical protein G5714_021974 [Onychostoma macrolepis]